jgi:hypothetical protein
MRRAATTVEASRCATETATSAIIVAIVWVVADFLVDIIREDRFTVGVQAAAKLTNGKKDSSTGVLVARGEKEIKRNESRFRNDETWFRKIEVHRRSPGRRLVPRVS